MRLLVQIQSCAKQNVRSCNLSNLKSLAPQLEVYLGPSQTPMMKVFLKNKDIQRHLNELFSLANLHAEAIVLNIFKYPVLNC